MHHIETENTMQNNLSREELFEKFAEQYTEEQIVKLGCMHIIEEFEKKYGAEEERLEEIVIVEGKEDESIMRALGFV